MTGAAGPSDLLAAAREGSRVALARLLSVVENDGEGARDVARATWAEDHGYSIGVTGAPGAGKSTLTDRLVASSLARAADAQVGVLCVDPSSPRSGGAILGDRVRMQDHALDPRVYIRSFATRGHLGGLSVAVPDALKVLGAVGFDLAYVETVGVGQVELEVAATADATVVVVTAGWGDAMQAAKAGLLEVADVFVVNKADRPGAAEARRDLDQMLDLGTGREDGWRPPVLEVVASEGTGVDAVQDALEAFRARDDGTARRARRELGAARLLERRLAARSQRAVEELVASASFREAARRVGSGELDPYSAVDELLGA